MLTEFSTANDFRAFFSAIPADQWCVGKMYGGAGSCCALGHLETAYPQTNDVLSRVTNRLRHLVCKSSQWTVSGINDGLVEAYPQSTPKERILALCDDLAAKGL